ncbi:uncharacterized protein LOC128550957 [Mercenaria mercenaria]|uniref:uncharacterized protein LOC128550957 n=1 Tax=Mercenaria mercenaria TaxID=6596 RepID=UPI00234E530C|nr:uncharacterized protein LOC128550957 [Mercenaria mercenaria]
MGDYFTFFVFFLCILPAYAKTTAKPKICWNTRWFNSFIPTETNRSDYEHQSAKILDSLCVNGSPIAAQCKDQKGEPFSGYKNDTVGKFIATCNVVVGLICNPYNNTVNETCPDYQVQYGCNCPKTTATGSKITGGKTTIMPGKGTIGTNAGVSTTISGSGSGNPGSQNTGSGTGHSATGQQLGQSGNSGQNLGISQIVLLLYLIMIISC